jgi:hypothetical protein
MAPIDGTGPEDRNPFQIDDDEPDDDPVGPGDLDDDEPAHDTLPTGADEDDLANDGTPD